MKKDSFSKKAQAVFSKNYLKMHQLFWDHEKPSEFIGSVVLIRRNLGIPDDLPFKDIYKEADGNIEKFYSLENKYQKIQTNFLKEIHGRKTVLHKGIDAILKQNNLGEEWEEMIALVIVTGACLPPKYNVSISRDTEKETITFTINRNTTKNDLDVAWKYTELIRKSLFENTRRISYPTETTFNNHKTYTESIIQKANHPDIIEDDGTIEGPQIKETSDKDTVAILYQDDEDDDLENASKIDKDRLNNLRVIRHRQKKTRGV